MYVVCGCLDVCRSINLGALLSYTLVASICQFGIKGLGEEEGRGTGGIMTIYSPVLPARFVVVVRCELREHV